MAKITNLKFFTVDPHAAWAGKMGTDVKVGNNRTITLGTDGVLRCKLHGHTVLYFDGANIGLDTCGHLTPTTRQAMNDFLKALAVPAKVSFADGYLGVATPSEHILNNGNVAAFTI